MLFVERRGSQGEMTGACTSSCVTYSERKGLIYLMLQRANLHD